MVVEAKVSDETLTTTTKLKVSSSNLDNYTCISDLKTDPKKLRLRKLKTETIPRDRSKST